MDQPDLHRENLKVLQISCREVPYDQFATQDPIRRRGFWQLSRDYKRPLLTPALESG